MNVSTGDQTDSELKQCQSESGRMVTKEGKIFKQ